VSICYYCPCLLPINTPPSALHALQWLRCLQATPHLRFYISLHKHGV
jgi:hypothetical protein